MRRFRIASATSPRSAPFSFHNSKLLPNPPQNSPIKGITQAQLARAAGILRPNLSRVESGKHRPSLETLEKIAAALKIPVVDLVLRK